jgi:mRNA interferase RelE/StbE
LEYSISYKKSVAKDLKRIDKAEVVKIIDSLEDKLKQDPQIVGKVLTGEFKGLFRLRIVNYRVIYSVMDDEVLILRIAHRQGSYQ